MVCYSAVVHLAIWFFLLQVSLSTHFKEAPVYYVDLLNLPVASPQAGRPDVAPGATSSSPAPPPPTPPQPRGMTLPAKAPARPTAATPARQTDPAETAREFEERIARLEQEAAARHQEAALAALRKRADGKGPAGIPGAAGTEAGSDYASYVRSRLEDAFRREDAFRTDPGKVVIVRLTIDRTGRIVNQRYEQRSNDRLFDDAVARAIARAEREFRRPPGGGQFEHGFVFRPQGVGKK
ncbi:MAG: TonB C-terminal domain-containing protein [Geobacteraceae bacterium]|nr:TonB C-terminal domain-containing protein [Geobacteraceae bacterium]